MDVYRIVVLGFTTLQDKDKSMETPQSSNVNLGARPSQQLLEQGLCSQLQFERAYLRGID